MRELSDKEDPLDEQHTGAGPLTGRFSNATGILVIGALMVFACAFLFAGAYAVDGSTSPITIPSPNDAVRVMWVFGWLFLVSGIVFLLLSVFVWDAKRTALEEAMFRVEPRDFEFNPVGSERIVEVVKVRCRYCGTLNEASAKNCTACGAAM